MRHTAKHNDIGLSESDFQANMTKNAVAVLCDPYKDIFIVVIKI